MASVTEDVKDQASTDTQVTVPHAPSPTDDHAADESLWQQDRATASTEVDDRFAAGPNYPVIFWLAVLHLGALAAPFFFSWTGLITCIALYWLAGSIGVCLGYHRLLTHGAFKTYRPMRWLIAFIGGLSGEGCVIDWVANHRKHHAHSDHAGDPHSPHEGPWWSHMLWLGWAVHGEAYQAHVKRWAPDLVKDPMMRWIGYMFLPTHLLSGAILTAVGYWMGGWYMGISLLLWGQFVRLLMVLHCTWLVNSWAHMWGYRTYDTTDDSRNNWLVALLTFGEGWHNNHHAYPRMASQGHQWWEVDITYAVIRVMKWTGLVWDVVDYKRARDRRA